MTLHFHITDIRMWWTNLHKGKYCGLCHAEHMTLSKKHTCFCRRPGQWNNLYITTNHFFTYHKNLIQAWWCTLIISDPVRPRQGQSGLHGEILQNELREIKKGERVMRGEEEKVRKWNRKEKITKNWKKKPNISCPSCVLRKAPPPGPCMGLGSGSSSLFPPYPTPNQVLQL